MTAPSARPTAPAGGAAHAPGALRPFRIAVPEAELVDLRERLAHTRWPDELPGIGWSRGVPVGYLRGLADYWRDGFDWRAQEAALNAWPQFTAEVDGQTIHLLHARSPEPGALPLLLIHSWPGSLVEFARLIGPLSDPRATGGDPADAFDVVIPSIPGFGYSSPLRATGWQGRRTATAFAALMRRLGYERYGVHGGDIGAGVAGDLAVVAPDHVIGVHVTTDPPSAVAVASFGGADLTADAGLSAAEREELQRLLAAHADAMGYLQIQSTRPQTMAYCLTDTPVGQLAWITEKFREWTDPTAELPEEAVDRDQLLANISLYWFTRTGASAAHYLYENMRNQEWGEAGTVETGWAVFGTHPITRRLLDPQRTIDHWSEFPRGGHFPAMEVPDLLVEDLRAFFRRFR